LKTKSLIIWFLDGLSKPSETQEPSRKAKKHPVKKILIDELK
jgi:hypothetical protein